MAWLTAIACVGILSFFVVEHAERLSRPKSRRLRRWYLGWTIKGFALPVAIWILFNAGVFDKLPSLVIGPDSPTSGPAYAFAVTHAFGLGVFAIATYWAALTSGWLLIAFYRDSDVRADFKGEVLVWACLLIPISLLVGWAFGWFGAGLAACLSLMPLLHIVRDLTSMARPKPTYSRAVARMHFDKYEEAETAVIKELEKCEDDFDGWLLLAELYAMHFHDLVEAERTLLETCHNPATTDSQRAVALNKLADWRLKLANDPVGARRHLETIREMMPGTHLAHMAGLRLQQLPATREAYVEKISAKKVRLPALRKDFDEADAAAAPSAAEREQAITRARRLSEKLQANPNSAPEREELARLLAEKLGNADAGLEQLDLLLTLPDRTEIQSAEWLALMAAWQLKYKRDESVARRILERVAREFPETAQAFAAQRRLNLMDMEAKMRSARSRAAVVGEPKISVLDG